MSARVRNHRWSFSGSSTRRTTSRPGEPVSVPVLRYYNVFNAEQLDGIEIPDAVKFEPLDFKPIESAEQIAAGYLGARRFP